MGFLKNDKLFPDACIVNIKSVKGTVDLTDFTKIYATPSSIKWVPTQSETNAGIVYKHSVILLYPGLAETDFQKFHDHLKDKFEVQIQFMNGDVFTLNNDLYPFKLSFKFIQKKGFQLIFKGSTPLVAKYAHNTVVNGLPNTLTFTL